MMHGIPPTPEGGYPDKYDLQRVLTYNQHLKAVTLADFRQAIYWFSNIRRGNGRKKWEYISSASLVIEAKTDGVIVSNSAMIAAGIEQGFRRKVKGAQYLFKLPSQALQEDSERTAVTQQVVQHEKIRERKDVKARQDPLGIIYRIQAKELGIFGHRAYIGKQEGLVPHRPKHHLRGNDECTKHLIEEIKQKGCTPWYEILGQYPIGQLDMQEAAAYAIHQESGWMLVNRRKIKW